VIERLNQFSRSFLGKRFFFIGGMLLVSITVGIVGYMLIEGWGVGDAFYMTVITLTTVGFGEVRTLSAMGRMFTVALIAGGIGIVAYGTSVAVELLASGELREEFLTARRKRMLGKLEDHVIVCGFGRMGQHVATELHVHEKPFVVIDISEEGIACARGMGYQGIVGDASIEEVLLNAGVLRAASLISVLDSDAANVFTVLTTRALNPDLIIVSRVNHDEATNKLRRAGANQVISPYIIGGRRMVQYVDNPGVVDFLDVVMHSPEVELQLAEVEIHPDSFLAGINLKQAQLRSEIGVNILSTRVPGRPPSPHPDIDMPLEPGVRLIALGNRKQLSMLQELAG